MPPYSLLLQNEEWTLQVTNLRINPAVQGQQGNIMTKIKEKLSPITSTCPHSLHLPTPPKLGCVRISGKGCTAATIPLGNTGQSF